MVEERENMDGFNEEERSILISFMILMGVSLFLLIMLLIQQSPGDGGIGIAIAMVVMTTVSGLAVTFLSFLLAIASISKYKQISKWWIKLLGLIPFLLSSGYFGMLFMDGSITL